MIYIASATSLRSSTQFQIWTSVFVMSGHPLTTDDEKTQNLTLHSEHLGWLLPELSLKKKNIWLFGLMTKNLGGRNILSFAKIKWFDL